MKARGLSEAAARGLSKLKDCSFAALPAISKDQLRQLVNTSFRDEFALLAALGWIHSPRVKLEAKLIGRNVLSEYTSAMGQAGFHSALGMIGACLVLKRRRRRRMASGAIPRH